MKISLYLCVYGLVLKKIDMKKFKSILIFKHIIIKIILLQIPHGLLLEEQFHKISLKLIFQPITTKNTMFSVIYLYLVFTQRTCQGENEMFL